LRVPREKGASGLRLFHVRVAYNDTICVPTSVSDQSMTTATKLLRNSCRALTFLLLNW
jgi:hypothetical protein